MTANVTVNMPDECGHRRMRMGVSAPGIERGRTSLDGGGRQTRGLQNRLWALRIQRLLVTDGFARLMGADGHALDKPGVIESRGQTGAA